MQQPNLKVRNRQAATQLAVSFGNSQRQFVRAVLRLWQ